MDAANETGDDRTSLFAKIPRNLHKAVRVRAAHEDRDIREIVEDALRLYLRTPFAARSVAVGEKRA